MILSRGISVVLSMIILWGMASVFGILNTGGQCRDLMGGAWGCQSDCPKPTLAMCLQPGLVGLPAVSLIGFAAGVVGGLDLVYAIYRHWFVVVLMASAAVVAVGSVVLRRLFTEGPLSPGGEMR